MKRFGLLVLVTAVWVAGCDDDNGTAPSAVPLTFSALLSPTNEVPAVTNAESTGRGAMQVTIVPTRDAAGAITSALANIHVQLYDYPAGVAMTGAHVHTGVAGVNGGIRIDTGIRPGQIVLSDGSLEMNFTGIAVDPAVAQGIESDPSAWYFNVHSTLNPGGFSRGQLTRVR